MPPKKKPRLSTWSVRKADKQEAARKRSARLAESTQQRQERQQNVASHNARTRADEDSQQREQRLQNVAAYYTRTRADENSQQRQQRLQNITAYNTRTRANEDSQHREQRLHNVAAHNARTRADEDSQRREQRLHNVAAHNARTRAEEDSQHREQRLHNVNAHNARTRADEDSQQRAQRVQHVVANHARVLKQHHRKSVHSIEEYVSSLATLPNPLNIGSMDIACCECKAKMWSKETHTGSMLRNTAKFSTCCSQGKIKLSPLQEPPSTLKALLTGTNTESTHFKTHIRAYNSSLAFVSLGVREHYLKGRGPPTFRIQGTVCHRTGNLLPDEGELPKFSQIFIYDVQSEAQHRMRWNNDLQQPCLQKLQNMLHEVNPFITQYKHAAEAIEAAGDDAGEIRLVLKEIGRDPRRYNLPSTSDISLLLPGTGEEPGHRDIVLYRRSGDDPQGQTLKRINESHQLYDPLHYVLLFPLGEIGWRFGIQLSRSKQQMSPMQFYCYRLMAREGFNTILRGGRLFQQYVVDMYAKIETQRLNFHRFNQDKIYAELYQGLCDAVHSGDCDGRTVGRLIVLPATFTGSPRSMHQHYQDAMAIVRKFGKPDLFITMTCNPNWPEITEALLPQQTASDRPDIVARVFALKMKYLIDQLMRKHILGKVIAFVYVVEFQKRGLPHVHILIILAPEDKPKTADDYNKFVSAEIPDKEALPTLYNIVTAHMIHGPCGYLKPGSPCMKDGVCSKSYPKDFAEVSQTNEDGYPIYKRPNNKRSIMKTIRQADGTCEQFPMDNRWVVPYNPYLTALLNTHINVEICNTIRAVKYLYKYVYKGNDMITAQISHQQSGVVDEISDFINARFVTPPESCWRIFHYILHDRSPAIQRLSVHLEDQQQILFREGRATDALDKAKDTTLMAWFKTNQNDADARKILYADFPENYTWDSQGAKWKTRKAGNTIGRMSTASPSQGERYYLRLLLTQVRGKTSFLDLRTLDDGTVCSTYKETALQLGLLESDIEWDRCLTEATEFKIPAQMRHLFAVILIFATPSEPGKLWDKHKMSLCEDVQYRRYGKVTADLQSDVINTALLDIDHHLQIHGKRLSDFEGFPDIHEEDAVSSFIHYFTTFSVSEQAQKSSTNTSMMNSDQRAIYDAIITATSNPSEAHHTAFFIDGPGGTGKTFVYNTLAATLRSHNKIVIPVATSGIAAEMLDVARTAHSTFKIPIPIQQASTCNIGRNTHLAKLIKDASLIIFDEAPMAHKHVIECLDRSLRSINETDKPFGGKVIAFGGDFRQVLPVVRNGSRATIVGACFKKSPLWKHVKILHLTHNMRASASGDSAFPKYLLQIGDGIEPTSTDCDEEDIVTLPPQISLQSLDGRIEDLISSVYPDLESNHRDSTFLCSRTILTTKNKTVDDINTMMIAQFPGESVTYNSADSVTDENQAALYPTEFLNSLTPSGLPPHNLTLKEQAPIMLLRNLDPAKGLLNGTRLIVKTLNQHVIDCEICTGRHRGSRVLIPRITLSPSDSGLPFTLRRRQFPVRVAFSMTINKSQGQTLEYVGLYLPEPVFTHGQLYVALSRARSFQNITVLPSNHTSIDGQLRSLTKNIVYKEILK